MVGKCLRLFLSSSSNVGDSLLGVGSSGVMGSSDEEGVPWLRVYVVL